MSGADSNQIVTTYKDRRASSSDLLQSNHATHPSFAAIIGASAYDVSMVSEVHWLAKESGAALTIYLVGPTTPWLSALMTPQAEQIKRLATRLDARLIITTPKDAVSVIANDWQQQKPSHIVFGPKRRWPWDIGLSQKVIKRLKAIADDRGITAIQESSQANETQSNLAWRLDQHRPWYHEYVLSLFGVCIAALSIQWLKNLMPAENLSIVFLTAVIFSATAYGFAAALFASVVSVILFDFFFVPPSFSFSLSSPDNILLVILFILMAGITSNLAGRLRDQAEAAREREGEARALFQLTRDIATSDTPEETYAAVARQSAALFDTETHLLLPHKQAKLIDTNLSSLDDTHYTNKATDPTVLQPVYPEDASLNLDEIEAARWAFSHSQSCGQGTDKFSVLNSFFQPLMTARGVVGILAFRHFNTSILRDAKAGRMFDSVCRLSAVAVERALQTQDLEAARVISQTESLRSALLSSISHDFGTPLASVIGSASSLITYGSNYTPEVTQELLSTILEEAERLNKFVNNLLQMTRVESGALVPVFRLADVDDLIGTVLDSAQRRLEKHILYVDVAERLPLINIDFVLMETVLMNLIENACKYSKPDTTITVTAYAQNEHVLIDVKDEGQGIPSSDLGAVFDKFFRVKARDRKVAGTGLGLAICKGIIEGQGGTIEALSDGPDKGTTIRIHLPADTANLTESI
ncbi:MAG: DUF4118 domain-containing protein [Rhodospirillaceae bacterium]